MGENAHRRLGPHDHTLSTSRPPRQLGRGAEVGRTPVNTHPMPDCTMCFHSCTELSGAAPPRLGRTAEPGNPGPGTGRREQREKSGVQSAEPSGRR